MSNRLYPWLRLVLGGTLLFGTSASSCVSDMIRDASDNLDELANDINDENDINDLDQWLDDTF
jgi:hypothetical protein